MALFSQYIAQQFMRHDQGPSAQPFKDDSDEAAPDKPFDGRVSIPSCSYIVLTQGGVAVLDATGEVSQISVAQASSLFLNQPVVMCHVPYYARRLAVKQWHGLDLLELFAFVYPGRFCVPTPIGMLRAMGVIGDDDHPQGEDLVMHLHYAAQQMMRDLVAQGREEKAKDHILSMVETMGLNGRGWGWTPFIFESFGQNYDAKKPISASSLNTWKTLVEWSDEAPVPPPTQFPVSAEESDMRLQQLLSMKRGDSQIRDQQRNYAAQLTHMFDPVDHPGDVKLVLAEAGTGVGKTLGYLAPASLWAEKNDGAVWVSTYTKSLQRQIESELDALYPEKDLKDAFVALRKGRENYLCLLNFQERAQSVAFAHNHKDAVALGIMARWVALDHDGDLTGRSFPAWLVGLLGYSHTTGLSDRRGECIYSACDHYHRCFVEKSQRKAKHARLVVANHAVVMVQAAMAGGGDMLPSRYVFDEGHHLFDAADGAFCAHLSVQEAFDLRRWLVGAQDLTGRNASKSRARGLQKRLADLIDSDIDAQNMLQEIVVAARILPDDNWRLRLKNIADKSVDNRVDGAADKIAARDESGAGKIGEIDSGKDSGKGGKLGIGRQEWLSPADAFFEAIYRQVLARDKNAPGPYSLETHVFPLVDGVAASAYKFSIGVKRICDPMKTLKQHLEKKLDDDQGELPTDIRRRLDGIIQMLDRKIQLILMPWVEMLDYLSKFAQEKNQDLPVGAQAFDSIGDASIDASIKEGALAPIDWFGVDRIDGQVSDIGFFRHYTDPMKIFADLMREHAHGIGITSATLRDKIVEKHDGVHVDDEDKGESKKEGEGWGLARQRAGGAYLDPQHKNTIQFIEKSPFDYGQMTKVFVVNDVNKQNLKQVIAAYRSLFMASGGGAMGIFTAIQRLRAVYDGLHGDLERHGLPLYAQHIDPLDPGTLVDMFREDPHSCLLGTDAMRDGVDVPGESLRLVVFDRVPWPRPTILHKGRRDYFGGRSYDEFLTRSRLKQAYGRLIRHENDRGVFVILDSAMPSRLYDSFPDGVEIKKIGLNDCIHAVRGSA